MKSISIFIFFLTSTVITAQNLVDLENAARGASGKTRVEQFINVADVAITQGDYNKAYDLANEAESFAEKINAPLLRAKALNRSGKALQFLSKRKGLFGKKERPEQYFTKSNDVLRKNNAQNDPLMMENFEQLKKIAENKGSAADLQNIEQQIAQIQTGGASLAVASGSRSELKQEVSNLNSALHKEKMTADTNRAIALRMLAQSQALQAQLSLKEATLNQMTEGQMKVEFMLLQQSQMLDSLLFRTRVDSLMLTNQNLALGEAKASRNFSYAIAAVLLLLSGGIAYSLLRAKHNSRVLSEKNRIIGAERERSDRLLLNILPFVVAEELKQKGSTSARFHEDVSVLFADFVNFTQIAERITPQQLVNDLDKAFDEIMLRHGLEKIKTIGDAYLSAGGLQDTGAQTIQIVNAARDMQRWLTTWNAQRGQQNLPEYHARIGIHRGPIVAGVVGAQKFAFDIWGDTVNIAARVEQASESGRINLSGAAHEALQGQIACKYRGKIPVKNKADIDMYFVEN
jgi:adenylate cyclase